MPKIYGVQRGEFIRLAEEVFNRFLTLPDNPKPDRVGAYLTLFDKSKQKILLVVELGYCRPEMADKWFNYSLEKTERLWKNRSKGHISSWESMDKGMYKFGGAITAPDDSEGVPDGRKLIGSLAGLTDYGEEAVLLNIWMGFGWLTLNDARKIASISGNEVYLPLLEACSDLVKV